MIVTVHNELAVYSSKDIVRARKLVSSMALSIKMSSMRDTELRTAVSELLTNAVRYASGGSMTIEQLEHKGIKGLRVVISDTGPGIADIEQALQPGFSTGKSLGRGLSGCKNLVDFFDFQSEPGIGTRAVIIKWC